MSSQDELNRGAAERLVRGGRRAWLASPTRVADVLVAASAPARPDELIGREAALAAFRAAPHDLVPRRRSWQMIKATIAKFLTVKAAIVCAATLGLGGVALAATTGTLPGPLGGGRPPVSATTSWPADKPSGLPSVPPTRTVPSPPAGLLRLCEDYLRKDADHRGRAIRERGFRDLAEQAGGQDRRRADEFCDRLLHHWPTAMPTTWPSGLPSEWPGHDPDGEPSRTPWPTGNRPTVTPTPSH